jgi:hypothetical protein
MRRLTMLTAAFALLATGAVTAAAVAQTGAGAKTTICHRAAKKYVAITVSNKALKTHVAHRADVMGAPVPQNNMKSARAYCAALPVLTPKQGGKKLAATVTNTLTGATANLDVRLRLGQGQLCFNLNFNLNVTGTTVDTATIAAGGTTVNLTPLPVAPATSSSGCVTLTRSVVKSILQNPAGATVTVTTAAGTLNGTLGKHS